MQKKNKMMMMILAVLIVIVGADDHGADNVYGDCRCGSDDDVMASMYVDSS